MLNQNLVILICLLILFFVLLTLGKFVMFLSSHTSLSNSHSLRNHDPPWISLIQNVGLLSIFMLQHTFQAKKAIKKLLHHLNCDVSERLLYNIGSCIVLQVVMYFWQPVQSCTLWQIPTSNHPLAWWFFTLVHTISWLIIYSGCYIMDLTELLGIKQVYHHFQHWPKPLCQKSEGLQRIYRHMRHPGFSTLPVIMFVHPVMQLDRLLLAFILTIYMILQFKVDDIDYAYQKRMLQRKVRDLSTVN
ncbi:nurim homolog [Uloborus diversus]|uniref:nurim homolog n=1 Tax=Uloborus diversus TaxID=327109 RepID=UPI00240A27C7|nr:nurim homolog [Uloborus diversus]